MAKRPQGHTATVCSGCWWDWCFFPGITSGFHIVGYVLCRCLFGGMFRLWLDLCFVKKKKKEKNSNKDADTV